MNYNEWLDLIELIKNSNRNTTYLQKMINAENNDNITEMLKPKLVELITEKTTKAIKNIIRNSNEMFKNPNSLELCINTFTKDIDYIYELCNLKQIDNTTRETIMESIKKEVDNIYDILIKKSLEIDRTGMYKIILEKKKNKR